MVVKLAALGAFMLLSTGALAALPDIQVVGLFKDMAVVVVDGKQELLHPGQRSPEGILLVSANSRGAVVEVGGHLLRLRLSNRVGTHYKPVRRVSVSIPLNSAGQFQTAGTVNGQAVSFLVDTGATIVAMNANQAKSLGIDYKDRGKVRAAMTAGGLAKSWLVTLDSIQIGGIRVTNVPAVVMQGDAPQDVLLGMTFLQYVDIEQSANLMVLKSKL